MSNNKDNNNYDFINNIGAVVCVIGLIVLTIIIVVGMKQTDTDNIVFLILAIAPLAICLKMLVMAASNKIAENQKNKCVNQKKKGR